MKIRNLLLIYLLSFLWVPCHAAGTISLSLTQQFGTDSKVLAGGKLYFVQAGTVSTPQNAFQDSALTIPWPNPYTLDARGFVPQLFFADGNIKVRLTDKNGVQIFTADNLLVVGPSGGGGGGGTVDPTTILSTGDFKANYGTGVLSGFVRCNARTIGSATSGATERANADTQPLFVYFWGIDANLPVSGGRGASGAADFAANKTLTLPDCRGRAIAGLDDMGNTQANRLTVNYFGANGLILGATGGNESQTLSLAQLPTGITTSGSNSITVILNGATGGNGVPVTTTPGNVVQTNLTASGGAQGITSSSSSWGGVSATSAGNNTINATSNNTGAQAHPIVQPTIVMTFYIKL